MRELLIILLVIVVLLGLTAIRYRKQILVFYRLWSTLRSMQRNNSQAQMHEAARPENGPLVNCAKCGAWTPESTAIRLGTRAFYCSSACMENAATAA